MFIKYLDGEKAAGRTGMLGLIMMIFHDDTSEGLNDADNGLGDECEQECDRSGISGKFRQGVVAMMDIPQLFEALPQH